ncbi:MBL fold metallo-hydrolase [Rathayibacter sp. VKM Ac-2760]|uniref:ComEC/Rec2 family competence protein n=1 Tax=Rathayibacter sp. VKM Ac-2760 TaxID=2609253 RepID=UPI0013182A35|nr:MBL fold metallo-hydrolase [Rathayibacter sp. VKM Ac-2760]QHC57535.1 MBL fold metallo-hydrolase [Rathayibacter sp. VKM Ac-2760]
MIEIEFLPIGEETDTGDAILLHFTEPATAVDRVVLIDGGFAETGEAVAAHVRRYYDRSHLDLVVCTHPDNDHIAGLFDVFERLSVGELLLHRPSEHGYRSDDVKSDLVDELIELARSHDTTVTTDAWAGSTFFSGALMIAGPTREYYCALLQEQTSPAAKVSMTLASLLRASSAAIRTALTPRSTDPGEGELTDHGGTTARNNSSIVLDVQVDGHRAVFTGDAGVPALDLAVEAIAAAGRLGSAPDFFDVPHHGSRHNLDSAVLDRLLGPVVGATGERTAFVSVGRKADEFPRADVANAIKRRGYDVCATRGRTIRTSRDAPPRDGWVALEPLPWVEPDE